MAPPMKDPSTRRRRNKPTTAAVLPIKPEGIVVPRLPTGRKWQAQTRKWWADVWASPMAAELVKSDVNELLVLAVLVDEFWTAPSKDLAAEIRLQRQCFGLTPIDRRRLQWEIERAEEAQDKRKARQSKAPATSKKADPRAALRSVS